MRYAEKENSDKAARLALFYVFPIALWEILVDMPDSFRALFIVEKSIVSSAFIDAWLGCGNTISAIWTRDKKHLESSITQEIVSFSSSVPTLRAHVKRHNIHVIRNDILSSIPQKRDLLSEVKADTLITLMTHQIVPRWIIDQFGRRAVNVHPALLPHYKGPKPTLSLLADGQADTYGGVTIHQLDAGIDTGPIIAQRSVPAAPGQNYHVWTFRLAQAAADLARTDLQSYLRGDLEAVAQIQGSGNYRKAGRYEFCVEAGKTLDEVRRLLAMPAGVNVRAAIQPPIGRRDTFPVHRSVSVVSEPTGADARVSPIFVEMDIRDCRIRMFRKRKAVSILSNPAISIAGYRLSKFWQAKDQV